MSTIPVPESRSPYAALFPPNVSVKKLVMPVEHGGWGILLEPIALGLIAAPSIGGALVALAAVAAFFARQPLKIGMIDRLRGKIYPRTRTAFAVAVLLSFAGAAAFAVAIAAGGWIAALPVVIAGPLALVQIAHDARNDSRRLLPEVSGAVAMSGVAAAIVLADGGSLLAASVIWGVMLGRAIPAILYIRSRVLAERTGSAFGPWPVVSHVVAIAAGTALWAAGLAPLVVPAAFAILLVRCAIGVSPLRSRASARRIGFTEIGYGTASILAIALGYAL
jgi:hypothetical protein